MHSQNTKQHNITRRQRQRDGERRQRQREEKTEEERQVKSSQDKRQETRDKRQETRDKRQETRDKRQETRDKRQETRDKRQREKTVMQLQFFLPELILHNYSVEGDARLMKFGGYVDMGGISSLPHCGVPLLHTAGELDGGAARPGKFACFYGRSKTWGEAHGEMARLTFKAVYLLPGLEHSDFFFVKAVKDVHSEVTQEMWP